MIDVPLEGIRVVDFCQYAPGPFATRELRSLGAEVIKIEPPGGDPMAALFCQPGEVSTAYRALNAGKQIVRGNLKEQAFLTHVQSLIEGADVVVEGFRPGVMERLGLSDRVCRQSNPGSIYCSISGYGQSGPWSDKAGHDINYCAVAGMYSYGHQSLFPLVADHSGAQSAVTAILAALLGRERTGQGCVLDIALYAPMLRWQYMLSADQPWSSNDPLSLLTGGAACYQIYETRDQRHMTLGALEPVFWNNFCDAVQRPDWKDRHGEALPQTGLLGEVAELFLTRELTHWIELLAPVDCCAEPVPLAGEVFDHPQIRARGNDPWFGTNETDLDIRTIPAWQNERP